MKTTKLIKKLPTDHYIVVDDSDIKEGDWVFGMDGIFQYQGKINIPDVELPKKITRSTKPIEEWIEEGKLIGYKSDKIRPLTLSEVKELLGEVDVEKKVRDYVQELIDCKSVKEHERTWISAICHKMYTQCLEDNKDRKYTEENVLMILQKTARKYFKEGREYKGNMAIAGDPLHGLRSELREYIQSLQPKTEWEVEIVDGKLKLKQ